MSRFDLNLEDVATERMLVPVGIYEARIVKGEIRQGETEKGKWANINLTLGINDADVVKAMNQDEPKVFWSAMFSFDEQGKFAKKNCPELGKFIEVTGFTDISDFEEGTEEMEVERDYILKVFSNMIHASIGTDLLCKVVQKPHYQDGSRQVNDVASIAKLEE